MFPRHISGQPTPRISRPLGKQIDTRNPCFSAHPHQCINTAHQRPPLVFFQYRHGRIQQNAKVTCLIQREREAGSGPASGRHLARNLRHPREYYPYLAETRLSSCCGPPHRQNITTTDLTLLCSFYLSGDDVFHKAVVRLK